MLSRYSNIDYILKSNWQQGYKQYSKCKEKEFEKCAWDKWLIDYQIMQSNGQKYITFEKFLKDIKSKSQNPKNNKTNEQILEEMEKVKQLHCQQKGGVN
ncbi:hypothetical protein [Acetivibrio cellulolyticus]|uniref:hypothetical protein n=1 Tax=Acetivibrio cellulolyticus TaxID=35830 RepID=UPI0001E2C291|nr:hypothetical protein [Acetivibrio cellulolyticus]